MVIEAEKTVDPEVLSRSVIEEPDLQRSPTYDFGQTFFWVTQAADEFIPWGPQYKARDKQLRNFITKEQIFASALGIVCSRNAAFAWHLNGPRRTLNRMHDILESADRGKGWESLIIKTSIDLYTQDSGAFWEIVREEPKPESPIIGINHLDAARCYHTGVSTHPVIYEDIDGKKHILKDYQVICFAEMPSPAENLRGVQYSALTRFLTAARERYSVTQRDYEKVTGRTAKKIILLQGITTKQMEDAIARAHAAADNAGLLRYLNPVMTGSISPNASVSHDTIDLTDPPEDYTREEYFKEYIGMLAMAFLTDYQEFSPLPGGNLGTSTQSSILHMKNRGKGAGLFRKIITRAINYEIFPRNVEFGFADPDYEAETAEAEVKKIRAQTRQIRVTSLEITPEVARQIANDEGDLRQEYLALMGEADTTDNLQVDDASPAETQIDEQIQVSQRPISKPPQPTPKDQTSASQGFGERARKILNGD